MTDIVDDLEWRGLLTQSTDREELRKALADGPVTLYCGFDPTAASLHIGSLVQILTLRRFQLAGHRPIALVGGATGLIGDPSGRSAERTLNPAETVGQWVESIGRQLERYLDFSGGPTGAVLVSNLDWTEGLTAIEFLRDIGKHFPVNRMLARETVKTRLAGEGMSYTEFSYVVLQAYDFLQLFRRYGCALQTGGSDQWGNLTAGVDLIRRVEGATAHALTTPILTHADGSRFGKTAGGQNVWLDPGLTSPYAFYQFWFNAEDADVVTYLKIFSFRSREEIEALARQVAERPAARTAQRSLAEELTALVHGADECARVVAASRALFGDGALGDLDEHTLAAAFAEIPSATVDEVRTVTDLFVDAGLSPSRSAARRVIADGGAYLNNQKIADDSTVPAAEDLLHGRFLVLRRGKRNVGGVEVRRRDPR